MNIGTDDIKDEAGEILQTPNASAEPYRTASYNSSMSKYSYKGVEISCSRPLALCAGPICWLNLIPGQGISRAKNIIPMPSQDAQHVPFHDPDCRLHTIVRVQGDKGF